MSQSRAAACWELARVFTWLGLTSFGGPAAHVALMERELVARRRWLDREELLDLIGLTQLVPGPNSTELAMAIGQRRAGNAGLIVAGACFILPAALMVGAIAALYLGYRSLPQVVAPLEALKPAVVAVVADAMRRLIPTSTREPRLAAVFGVATAAALLGAPELAVVVAGGLVALATFRAPPTVQSHEQENDQPSASEPAAASASASATAAASASASATAAASAAATAAATAAAAAAASAAASASASAAASASASGAGAATDSAAATEGEGGARPGHEGERGSGMLALPLLGTGAAAVSPSVAGIFAYFFKVGAVLYGSGYVLLAFLRSGLVEELGWLTEGQLLDAIAVGQFTPGPVFTTATFIGYLIGGAPGAAAATVGIFGPAFLFIAAAGPLLRHLLLKPWFRPFLDGVNAASLGLLLAVVLRLGAASCAAPLPALIALLSFGALYRFDINSAWVMASAGMLGWATRGLLPRNRSSIEDLDGRGAVAARGRGGRHRRQDGGRGGPEKAGRRHGLSGLVVPALAEAFARAKVIVVPIPRPRSVLAHPPLDVDLSPANFPFG